MAQMTIYLAPAQALQIKKVARLSKKSISQWVSGVISEKLENQWPAEFLASAGTWSDFPDSKELRHEFGKDTPRVDL